MWGSIVGALSRLVPLGGTPGGRDQLVTQAREAVAELLGRVPGDVAQSLPLSASLHPLAVERVLDALVLVAIAVGLVGLGHALRASEWPRLRPAVFASGALAVVLYGAVNPAFWRVAAVRVDRDGVTLLRYATSDRRVRWRDVTAVSVRRGAPLPVFQDDRALRLTPRSGAPLDIPRFVPGVERVLAAIPGLIAERATLEENHGPHR